MTTLAADALAWLIESTAALSAATLLVLLLRLPARRLFGARVAYALWLLPPLALLAVSLPGPMRESLLSVAAFDAPQRIASAVVVGEARPLGAPGARADWLRLWPLPLWLGGAALCALWFAHRQRRYLRALGRLRRDGDGLWHAEDTHGCPAVVGAWAPRIVLPADFAQRYPAHEGALVLAHERAHLRRGDTRVHLLVAALRCLFWFNPLLHWAASRLRDDQELACDALVLAAHPQSRRAYADAMLKTQLAQGLLPYAE